MTNAERVALNRAYTALMRRVRAFSAQTSREGIAAIDATVKAARLTLNRIAAGDLTLTTAKADELLRQLTLGLEQIQAKWIATAQGTSTAITSGIITEARTVHFTAAQVEGLDEGGIVLKLRTVPQVVRAGLPFFSPEVVARNISGHMDDIGEAMQRYIEASVGVRPSAEAIRGIQKLLNGDLPVDISGISDADAKMAASLDWKVNRSLVTQSFSTYRTATAASLDAAPVDLIAHWDLSPRHVVPDECDDIANLDVGYGPGWYPPDQWPDAPHPNCQCGQGDIQVVGATD